MKGIKTDKKTAQKKLDELRSKNLTDNNYRVRSLKDGIAIPIKKAFWEKLKCKKYKFDKIPEKPQFRDLLKKILTPDELTKVKTAYDIVGSIAILEIDDELRSKEKKIGQAMLDSHNSVYTVVRKDAGHEGELRTQKMKYLAGVKTFVTTHIENGCTFEFDISKTYFSVRLSHERKRILKLVKPNEDVLVMFSGVGPYPIEISKHTKAKSVVAIELNKYAHNQALINIVKNKVSNVLALQGDVRAVTPELNKQFDRILMPLPKSAGDFLDVALSAAKENANFHFYDFQHENEFHLSSAKIRNACMKNKKKCQIIRIVKCGQSSPREFRICVDFSIK